LSLRSKFLLALVLISSLLTCSTLVLVRRRVESRVRDEIVNGFASSVATFRTLQQQRVAMLERSAALLSSLPPLKAVMTSQHAATIQDASATFWKLSGSQLFVLSDPDGAMLAMHTAAPGFSRADAQTSMLGSVTATRTRDWWFGNGHLFEVFLEPIHFGPASDDTKIGILAIGYEVDRTVAADLGLIASSEVVFRYKDEVAVSTIASSLVQRLSEDRLNGTPAEVQIGQERFLAASVAVASGSAPVTLTLLRSFDQATAFLKNLNRWIIAVGLGAVLVGSVLVFVVSTTFTRPLARLAAAVKALEKGNFAYPLQVRGRDEVAVVTSTFVSMRARIQETQKQLLDAERLSTIGRMASTISHDLRHPLTAVMAYAEFLSAGNLSEERRKDYFNEIRIAITRMTDELNSLLGFSKESESVRPAHGRIDEVIGRAVQLVKVLPEYQSLDISVSTDGSLGWFDGGKMERAILNLLFNACQAVSPETGQVQISSRLGERGIEIRIADNGPGIPESIRDKLFQPFVSSGKETGIGLGLTVVQRIVHDHGGEVYLERTGPSGTTFALVLPNAAVGTPTA
jgi:signal transduction histidine kinase